MNTKTLTTLIVIAAVCAGGAWFASRSSDAARSDTRSTGPKLFPELEKRVNDVAKVEITNKDGKFALERKGDQWGMTDKGGYPINFDKVKELVVGVSNMEIVEKKTAKPELHSSLDVQDVTVKDSPAVEARFFDAGGQELAAVVLGKARTTKSFGGQYAMFVRKVGDPQAYEVTGRLYVDGTSTNWLDKQIVKLEKTRVRQVETKHADGTVFEIKKNVPEDQAFAVTALPEGAELKWNGVADGVAAALEWLNFEDVAPAGSVDLAGVTPTETTFTTWDGMRVVAKLYEKDDKAYLVMHSSFDEAARYQPEPEVGPQAPPESSDPSATPEPAKSDSVGKAPEDVRKDVEELNAKFQQWTYVIPGWNAANFKKTVKDMVKEPTPPSDGTLPGETTMPPGETTLPPGETSLPLDGAVTPSDLGDPVEGGIQDDHAGHDHSGHDHPHETPPVPPTDEKPKNGDVAPPTQNGATGGH